MLKAKVIMPDGIVVNTKEGAPQGGPLSPLLSNIVLDELDSELTQRNHKFVRYADDCNIYVKSQRAGLRVMDSISRFIKRKLRLNVNLKKSAVAKPNRRHFLGFSLRVNSHSSKVNIALSKRSKDRINQRIKELTPRNWGKSLKDCIKQINAYLIGWIGFFWICSNPMESLFSKIDAHIRRRLRALILKQWKRKRFIVRRLISLGIKSQTAWRNTYKGKQSLWKLSYNYVVNRALNNAFFNRCGLISISSQWKVKWSKYVVDQFQINLKTG